MVIAVAMLKLPAKVRKGIPRPPDLTRLTVRLEEIEGAANRVHNRVEKLDRRLKADAVTDYRRSVVLTLIGTLVG